MTVQLLVLLATVETSVTPFAVDSYFFPILSLGVPGNMILCRFSTGCGSSITREMFHKLQTVTSIGPLLWTASSAAMPFSCRRFASEIGARMQVRVLRKTTVNWLD